MTNRLIAFEATVQNKLDVVTDDKKRVCDETMNIDFSEHYTYQSLQSRAFASGFIQHDEAQTVYNALGEVWSPSNGGWKQGVPLARKLTITKFMAELAGRFAR